MRILFVEHFGAGGMAHYAHSLCEALAQRGLDISLLSAADYELADVPRSFRLLNRLPMWNPYRPDRHSRSALARIRTRVVKGLRYLGALGIALMTIWRERPDIVHISEMKFPPDLLLFLFPGQSRVVHTCHNVQRFSDSTVGATVRTSRVWHWAQSSMYRRCRGVIFHADENVREFQQVFGFEPACWDVIPHGEYDLFRPPHDMSMIEARDALGLGHGGQLVLFFGMLRKYKGLDVLLQAMARLVGRVSEVGLLVAGAAGRDMDVGALRASAQKLGIDDRVIWRISYVPRELVPAYFYACDVVALSHRKVYDSGVLKIAQALGRPVVVTRVGGLPSAVDEGRAGLVVPPEDPEALAQALADLLLDPELARALGRRGRVLADTVFNWAVVGERTEALYRRVLESQCAY